MNPLEMVVKNMMLQAGFAPQELLNDVVEETMEVPLDRIVTSIEMKLSAQDRIAFLQYIDANDMESAFALAKKKIPNYTLFYQKVLSDFEDEYLAAMKE